MSDDNDTKETLKSRPVFNRDGNFFHTKTGTAMPITASEMQQHIDNMSPQAAKELLDKLEQTSKTRDSSGTKKQALDGFFEEIMDNKIEKSKNTSSAQDMTNKLIADNGINAEIKYNPLNEVTAQLVNKAQQRVSTTAKV